jgi:hypothetical protein
MDIYCNNQLVYDTLCDTYKPIMTAEGGTGTVYMYRLTLKLSDNKGTH